MAELEKLDLLPSLMELSVVGNPVSVVGVTDKVLIFNFHECESTDCHPQLSGQLNISIVSLTQVMYQCHTFAVPCPSHCAAPELSDQLQPVFFLSLHSCFLAVTFPVGC